MDLQITNSFKSVTLTTENPAETTAYKSETQIIAPPERLPLYREPGFSPFDALQRWRDEAPGSYLVSQNIGDWILFENITAANLRNYANNRLSTYGFDYDRFLAGYNFDYVVEYYWNPSPNYVGKLFVVLFQNYQGLCSLNTTPELERFQHVLNEPNKKAIYPSEPGSVTVRISSQTIMGNLTSKRPYLARSLVETDKAVRWPFDAYILGCFGVMVATPLLTTSANLNFNIYTRTRIENFVPIGLAPLSSYSVP